MKLKTFALAAALLSAVPMQAALAAPSQTYAVLHASEPAIPAGMGRIYFYREGGLLGAAMQPTIMIDGQSAGGRSKPGDYFYIDRPAGTYTISTSTEKKETTTVTVVAGEAVYVKTEVSMGFLMGHVSPSVVDAQTAANEIKDCDWHAPEATATATSTSTMPPGTATTPPGTSTTPPSTDSPKSP